jgi:hypothetical protein
MQIIILNTNLVEITQKHLQINACKIETNNNAVDFVPFLFTFNIQKYYIITKINKRHRPLDVYD